MNGFLVMATYPHTETVVLATTDESAAAFIAQAVRIHPDLIQHAEEVVEEEDVRPGLADSLQKRAHQALPLRERLHEHGEVAEARAAPDRPRDHPDRHAAGHQEREAPRGSFRDRFGPGQSEAFRPQAAHC